VNLCAKPYCFGEITSAVIGACILVGAATLIQTSTAARRIWRLHPRIGVRGPPMQRIDQTACNGLPRPAIGCIIKIVSAGQNLSELGLRVS